MGNFRGFRANSGGYTADDADPANVADFNKGLVAGDAFSIVLGGLMIDGGLTLQGVATTGVGAIPAGVTAAGSAGVAGVGLINVGIGTILQKNATGRTNNYEGRKQVTKVSSTRKEAKDARPKPNPAKPGEKQVTNQTRNKSGEGNKMKTDGGSQTPHFHDKNHNNKNKANVHYRVGKKQIKTN